MAASGAGHLGRGLDMSLAALRRHDPYIQRIVDVASQVALYTFSHQVNEWEKTDVEGTLFVYSRSASPKHGFTIMNRLSMENRTEPITKDLDFQLQDPFLLYRNARFCIYGIWFYDKEECQRIAKLMKNLTQEEQLKAYQAVTTGASPMMLHSDGKEVDILQMLNKAKNEYAKCKPCSEPKAMTNSSAIHSNPNLIKPIAVKPGNPSQNANSAQQNKSGDAEPRHLSLSALFGKAEETAVEGSEHADPSKVRPAVVRSLSYEDPARLPEGGEKQLCPAIQKLMVRGADLLPVSQIPEKRIGIGNPPGDVFSSLFLPIEDIAIYPAQEPDIGESILQKLASNHPTVLHPKPRLTLAGPLKPSAPGQHADGALLHFYDGPQQSQRTPSNLPTMPLSSPSPGTISHHELLKKLNLVRQDQQYQASAKPALAAKFPLVPQPAMKATWAERIPPNALLQIISPQQIPATVSPSVLLSPLVFTQTNAQKTGDVTKPSLSDTEVTANLLLPLSLTDPPNNGVTNQSSVLTKSQLRDALLHLIQNDEGFLNTIHEGYLSVLNRRGAATGLL